MRKTSNFRKCPPSLPALLTERDESGRETRGHRFACCNMQAQAHMLSAHACATHLLVAPHRSGTPRACRPRRRGSCLEASALLRTPHKHECIKILMFDSTSFIHTRVHARFMHARITHARLHACMHACNTHFSMQARDANLTCLRTWHRTRKKAGACSFSKLIVTQSSMPY